jgi:hypothetical protein
VGILTESYGKYNSDDIDRTVIMEYDNFLEYLIPFNTNPAPPDEFNTWILSDSTIMSQFADFMMYTLPLPRYQWYEPSNFQVIQDQVTALTNEVTEKLGFYETRAHSGLL